MMIIDYVAKDVKSNLINYVRKRYYSGKQ